MDRHFRRPIHAAEKRLDVVRRAYRKWRGLRRPVVLMPYRTFGTEKRLWVRGRVVEDKGVLTAPHHEGLWENLRVTFARFESDEVPGAEIEWRFGEKRGAVVSDEEGFFDFHIDADLEPAQGKAGWRKVELTLRAPLYAGQSPVAAEAHVLTPGRRARFGVVSDIDDTIVVTGATSFLKNWRTVVASHPQARVAFPGLAPFYRALEGGGQGAPANPIFYVSSSPWNLFDLFERFLVLHAIPLGPMLLKDIGLDNAKWAFGGHDDHKTASIERLFSTYPDLPFILIGDSGQRDTEIYGEIVRRHPERVRAVYIRDVTHDQRDTEAKRLLDAVKSERTRVAYGPDLVEAAEDAGAAGWIDAKVVEEVRRAVAERRREGTV